MECYYIWINVFFLIIISFTLRGHGDVIIAIRLTKDDKYLATASKDCAIRIWNFDTGIPYSICLGHKGSVNAIKV